MILEKDVTRDMLADVVQSYLDDLRKEKKRKKLKRLIKMTRKPSLTVTCQWLFS